jgi:trk system potassium uptake protein TrkH
LTIAWWKQLEENGRLVLFQVISILTTTGFGTRDIGSAFFGHGAKQLFLVMMVVGGCVGSTGGGIKILRVSILLKLIRRELFRLRTPSRSISTIFIDGKPLAKNEVYRVSGLFFTWIVLLVFGGCVTAFLSELDGYQAFSGMFSALGNIGPCYIPVQANGLLHPVIKLVYIFGMLAGRLEILPVLLLFSPKAWRS